MGGGLHGLSRRLFMAHVCAAAAGCVMQTPKKKSPSQVHIRALRLQTSQPIAVMRTFYAERLGFEVEEESERSLTLRTGPAPGRITFDFVEGVAAHYHFAFNIPQNQIISAYEWQKQRTEFILPPEELNDEGMPRAVVAFRHWNAHSLFFWDPAMNAVEYIARHDLKNDRDGEFSLDNILAISEIGLIVDDVPAIAAYIKEALGAATYVGHSDEFHPVGDQNGLLLVFKRGRKQAFGQGRDRDMYPTEVRLKGDEAKRVKLPGVPYTLVLE